MSDKTFAHLKLFLILFIIFFAVFFFLFNGTNIDSIFSFKVKNFSQRITQIKNDIIGFPDYLKQLALNPKSTDNKDNYNFDYFPINTEKEKKLLHEADTLGGNMLYIPKFDVEAPIISVQDYNLKLIYKELMKGVVLFPGSDDPGDGYSIILGHSSHYPWQKGKYISVFRFLGQAQKGDEVDVVWKGQVFIFRVVDKKVFLPWPRGTATTRSVFPPSDQPTLILQSCLPFGWGYKRIALKTILEK